MISVTKLILVFVTICALRDSTLAQTVERPSQTTPGVQIAQAVRVEEPPKLDGTVDDPIWQQAVPIKDFRQKEPYEGQPATESTEVRILYTHKEIYFGIACHDSAPHVIVATQLRRDVTQELDDYFEIVIDSRHDRRNAYVFQINPLGTQRDALITDEQVSETPQDGDPGWDGVWSSEARIKDDGWTATVAIPFSTLNFMRSQDVVWGLNFKRFIRRKNEEDLWSGWKRTFGVSKISEAGELHGITDGAAAEDRIRPSVANGEAVRRRPSAADEVSAQGVPRPADLRDPPRCRRVRARHSAGRRHRLRIVGSEERGARPSGPAFALRENLDTRAGGRGR